MRISHIVQATAFLLGSITATSAFAQQQAPRVLILVTSAGQVDGKASGMWLEEFAAPYQALVQAKAKVTVVSPKGGETPIDPNSNSKPEEKAMWQKVAAVLQKTVPLTGAVHASDYDAIFIPGGHGPLVDLAVNAQAARLISEFARSGKPVASVCHGPAALAGVTMADGKPFVNGKKMTAFSDAEETAAALFKHVPFSVQQKMTTLGARYSQGANFAEYAVVDGNLITGQNPASSAKVAALLLEQLNSGKRK
jgi:putative intracellular protease/amidase